MANNKAQAESRKKYNILGRPFIQIFTIILFVSAVYSITLNAPFQFDDFPNIRDNPAIKDFDYFTDSSKIQSSALSSDAKAIFRTRSLGYLTFAINHKLHGLDVEGYHLVNILIHAANSAILYMLMTLTFRTPFFSGNNGSDTYVPCESRSFISMFTALLFAVHPIQTQAVTYIVQRFASLATFFYLLSLVFYILWRFRFGMTRKPHERIQYFTVGLLYAASLFFAICAMKTKELTFTLPMVMLMYELMFFKGNIKRKIPYLIPFFIAVLIIPLSLIDTGKSVAGIENIYEAATDASGALGSISAKSYLLTQSRVIVTYIRLLLLPINQNLDYDYPIYDSFFDPGVVISCIFLLSLLTLGLYLACRSRLDSKNECVQTDKPACRVHLLRLTGFGIIWFFVTTAAESCVIPVKDVIFEHRVYLPSVGFFIALTSAIDITWHKRAATAGHSNRALVYVMGMLAIVLAVAACNRNALWKSSINLWKDTVAESPYKARPHNELGVAYAEQGYIDMSINEFLITIQINPNDAEAHNNLGNAYLAQGRIDEAINEFLIVLRLNPKYADAHNNLGAAYAKQGRIDQAKQEFKKALLFDPEHSMARQNLSVIDKKIQSY